MNELMRVKLTTSFPHEPIIRQTPGERATWENFQFLVDEPVDECDFWVVYEGLTSTERAHCPESRVILITGEPPAIKKYNRRFLKQFSTVVTCHDKLNHPAVIHSQTALPWAIGRKVVKSAKLYPFTLSYDHLKSIRTFDKKRLISTVSSTKADIDGHTKRLEFVRALAAHFSPSFDLFGRGMRPVEDKWDAIAPYKYHIVIENSRHRDYWTEKLADTFLAGAYPFYYGCPNLTDYFSSDSFTPIDIDDLEGSISTIESCIANDQYEKSAAAISAARLLVLDKYNLFPLVANLCSNMSPDSSSSEITLRPEHTYSLKRNVRLKIRPRTRWRAVRSRIPTLPRRRPE
jgi:hypothetical protein